jgi:rare lipoprotein A
MRLSALIMAMMICAAGSLGQTSSQSAKASSLDATAMCSYYARMHNGHTTAGGEKFDSEALTAAHRTFPMGTKLKVTNLATGKSVVVRVNDRGPFVKGRDLSVTRRAARELGFLKEGIAKVRLEQVQ